MCRTARRHGTPCRWSRQRRHNAIAAAGRVWSGSRSPADKRRKSRAGAAAPRSRSRPCARGTARLGTPRRSAVIFPLSVACAGNMGPADGKAKLVSRRLPIVAGRFTPSRRTVGLCRPPTGPMRWTKPSKRLTSSRREPRASARFQSRHQWIARARGPRRGRLPRRSRLASRRLRRRRHLLCHLGLSHFANHSGPVRRRAVLAGDVLREAGQAHPARASRGA